MPKLEMGSIEVFGNVRPDKDQIMKIAEEWGEAYSAWEDWLENPAADALRDNLADELADVLQATANMFAALGYTNLRWPIHDCEKRNGDRGRYAATGADPVNHPAHYERGGIETIGIVEKVVEGLDARQGFCLANVLKYVLRAGQKGDADTDLAKANNYAHRLCTGEWRWQHGQA